MDKKNQNQTPEMRFKFTNEEDQLRQSKRRNRGLPPIRSKLMFKWREEKRGSNIGQFKLRKMLCPRLYIYIYFSISTGLIIFVMCVLF